MKDAHKEQESQQVIGLMVKVPRGLHRQLKILADQNGRTIQEQHLSILINNPALRPGISNREAASYVV